MLIGFSCKNRGTNKAIGEGEIHYNIEYAGDVSTGMLPKTLIISFKQNKAKFEMLSAFGNSGIVNILNPEDEIYDTYFTLLTLKYYYEGSAEELFPGFDAMEGIEITKTSKVMEICGYNCKNAEVTLPFDRNKIMSVWYTDEIAAESLYITTPFKEIEGVLLDFFCYIGDTEFRFSAKNVYLKTISDDTFARRSNYKKISKEEISSFIYKMVSF